MVYLIAEAVIVAASSWLVARRFFDNRLFSELILTSFLLFFAQIVLVGLLLGMAGKLYFWNVFLAQVLIFISAVIFCYKKGKVFSAKPDLDFFINNKLLLFAFAVFSSFFLAKAFVNLINPPISPGSMQQHLVFPATWIVNGNLNNPFQIFGSIPILNPAGFETSSASYYPINAQLFYTWLMLPLRNAFLADAGEAPFYVIGIIAVYAILRKYNVERGIALLSGFLWALIPNLFKQLKTGSEIDVICAVLFLLVFLTALLLKQDFTLKNVILFGISVGLLAGTKIINFVWLFASLPLILYLLYKGAKQRKLSLGQTLTFAGIILGLIILFSGFIFVKNYLYLGNPLFPVNLKIFGRTIFKGLLDSGEYKMQVAPWGMNLTSFLFKEGLGLQLLFLILPVTFIPLITYKYWKARFYPSREYLLLFATPLIMLIVYGLAINIYTTRYLYTYLSFGLVAGVIFTSRFSWGKKYLFIVSFLSILFASFELANGYELVASILLSVFVFTGLVLYRKKIAVFYAGRGFSKFILALFLAVSVFLIYLNHDYDREEFNRYPLSFSKKESAQRDIGRGWKALNELTGKGAKVAYTGRQEYYPLYGRGLKNRVIYVSVNEKEITPYNNPDGKYRRVKDFSAWRNNLKKYGIEYLFIARPIFNNRESADPDKFPIEDEWANAHPEDFQLVFNNSLSRIYKVLIK